MSRGRPEGRRRGVAAGLALGRNTTMAWWAHELIRMRPQLEAYLTRRATFAHVRPDEVAGQVVAEVVERIQRLAPAPEAWLVEEEPPAPDAAAFRGLVWTICRRRLFDTLRSHYARARALPDAPPAPPADPEATAIARQVLGVLARLVDALPLEERELLARSVEPPVTPLTPAERMRLTRLRRALAAAVAAEIGRT